MQQRGVRLGADLLAFVDNHTRRSIIEKTVQYRTGLLEQSDRMWRCKHWQFFQLARMIEWILRVWRAERSDPYIHTVLYICVIGILVQNHSWTRTRPVSPAPGGRTVGVGYPSVILIINNVQECLSRCATPLCNMLSLCDCSIVRYLRS